MCLIIERRHLSTAVRPSTQSFLCDWSFFVNSLKSTNVSHMQKHHFQKLTQGGFGVENKEDSILVFFIVTTSLFQTHVRRYNSIDKSATSEEYTRESERRVLGRVNRLRCMKGTVYGSWREHVISSKMQCQSANEVRICNAPNEGRHKTAQKPMRFQPA